jgi:hypothetical protein
MEGLCTAARRCVLYLPPRPGPRRMAYMVTQSPGFPFAHVRCGLLSDRGSCFPPWFLPRNCLLPASQATETRRDCRARRPRPAAGGGPVRSVGGPVMRSKSASLVRRATLSGRSPSGPCFPPPAVLRVAAVSLSALEVEATSQFARRFAIVGAFGHGYSLVFNRSASGCS